MKLRAPGLLCIACSMSFCPVPNRFPSFKSFSSVRRNKYHGYLDELNLFFDVDEGEVHMEVEISRGTRTLNTSFSWLLDDPDGTLTSDHGDPNLPRPARLKPSSPC